MSTLDDWAAEINQRMEQMSQISHQNRTLVHCYQLHAHFQVAMHDCMRRARVQELETARHILAQTALGAPLERPHLPVQVCSQVAV